MELKRMFTTTAFKGTRNYLNAQKKYEIIRTALYFGISLSLFAAGYIQTGERANLLSIVAVLGCLPAAKSAVSAIMFLRCKSCSGETASAIEQHSEGLNCLYDMVFTSYKKNYFVSHLAVCGNTVCGFAEATKESVKNGFDENGFYKHIGDILKLDGHQGVTVKIFTSLPKYTERLDQMRELEPEESKTKAVIATLKSVVL